MSSIVRTGLLCGLASLALLVGCSDDSTGSDGGTAGSGGGAGMAGSAGESGCELPDGSGAEPVSLRDDVMPVFGLSCVNGPCHGETREAKLYLGPPCKFNSETKGCDYAESGMGTDTQGELTDEAVAEVLANLVDVPSETAASVKRVASGDSPASFVMHKITDTHNDQGHSDCEKVFASAMDPCGDAMPPLGEALCAQGGGAERVMTIAAWIAQGAKDN